MTAQHPTIVVFGPKGCGKTTNAETLRDCFNCIGVVDDWDQDQQIKVGHLHLLTGEFNHRRGGPVVAMSDDFKVVDSIEVYSFADAINCPRGSCITGRRFRYADNDCADSTSAGSIILRTYGAMLTQISNEVHRRNVAAGWWTDLETGEDLHGKHNTGELLALVHSEVSEALEGHRKGLMDDKLPHHPMFRVELVDALIRILDILGSEQNEEHQVGDIFVEKLIYNGQREDHKPENRRKDGGKKI